MLSPNFEQLFSWSNGQLIVTVIFFILCFYPIVGSFFWFAGSLSYRFLRSANHDSDWTMIPAAQQPLVSILIPAHNEEVLIRQTVTYLFDKLHYNNYEILVMNDGSTDQTGPILKKLQTKYPQLRVIEIENNKGKAHAFNIGLSFAKGEFILSNDADTIPEPDALMKYMNYFIHDYDINTSAVTANMDVQNRTKLIGKSQTIEFSSIIGVIRRSQVAINNSMYAYSGCNTLYRKSFLIDVGGFRQNRATEDISIAWDHQNVGGVPRFAPNITVHMNVPETVRDLYRQRKRWAQGGTEVWLTNVSNFLHHPIKLRYQLSLFIDVTLSIFWSFFFFISTLLFFGSSAVLLWTGNVAQVTSNVMLAMIFITFELLAGLLQLLAALCLDQHSAKLKYWFFSPFYLLFYWLISPTAVVLTFIPAVKTILGHGSGTWVSPSRQ